MVSFNYNTVSQTIKDKTANGNSVNVNLNNLKSSISDKSVFNTINSYDTNGDGKLDNSELNAMLEKVDNDNSNNGETDKTKSSVIKSFFANLTNELNDSKKSTTASDKSVFDVNGISVQTDEKGQYVTTTSWNNRNNKTDCVWDIAKTLDGEQNADKVSKEILSYNGITDPTKVADGQKIYLPSDLQHTSPKTTTVDESSLASDINTDTAKKTTHKKSSSAKENFEKNGGILGAIGNGIMKKVGNLAKNLPALGIATAVCVGISCIPVVGQIFDGVLLAVGGVMAAKAAFDGVKSYGAAQEDIKKGDYKSATKNCEDIGGDGVDFALSAIPAGIGGFKLLNGASKVAEAAEATSDAAKAAEVTEASSDAAKATEVAEKAVTTVSEDANKAAEATEASSDAAKATEVTEKAVTTVSEDANKVAEQSSEADKSLIKVEDSNETPTVKDSGESSTDGDRTTQTGTQGSANDKDTINFDVGERVSQYRNSLENSKEYIKVDDNTFITKGSKGDLYTFKINDDGTVNVTNMKGQTLEGEIEPDGLSLNLIGPNEPVISAASDGTQSEIYQTSADSTENTGSKFSKLTRSAGKKAQKVIEKGKDVINKGKDALGKGAVATKTHVGDAIIGDNIFNNLTNDYNYYDYEDYSKSA